MKPGQEMIKLYAKQLRLPTLTQIDDLIRQAVNATLKLGQMLAKK